MIKTHIFFYRKSVSPEFSWKKVNFNFRKYYFLHLEQIRNFTIDIFQFDSTIYYIFHIFYNVLSE